MSQNRFLLVISKDSNRALQLDALYFRGARGAQIWHVNPCQQGSTARTRVVPFPYVGDDDGDDVD